MAADRTPGERVGLLLADLAAIQAGFALAYWLRYERQLGGPIAWYNDVPYRVYVPWALVLTAILVPIFWAAGLYSRRRSRSGLETVWVLASSTVVGIATLTVLMFGLRPVAQSRLMLPYAAAMIIILLAVVRLLDLARTRRRFRRGEGVIRALIVGAGDHGRAVMRNIMARPDAGYSVVGFLDDDPAKREQPIGRYPPLGSTDDLARVLSDFAVDEVIIALPWQARERIVRLVSQCEAAMVRARIVPDLFQLSLRQVDLDSLNGIPLLSVRRPTIGGWARRAKRAMDVLISALALVLLSPLLALIAVAIRLDSPGGVLFRQPRVGRDGRAFTCYKFRSMVEGADEEREALLEHNEATGPIFKMRRDPRLTRVGRFLRRASLDELPQLWNVLRGDMSLVGPRPAMPDELAGYQPWHRRRLEIAPGLTGLWQVSGRSELTFDEMVMLDLYYAENWSIGLDVRILLRTIPTVILGTGAF